MKKLIFIIILAAISAAGIAQVERTGAIRYNRTMLSRPMAFTTADTITTSDTTNITIHNPQSYMQHQVFTYTIDEISGGPGITVKAYGKVSADGAWTQIGSTMTWDEEADNPQSISSTAPLNYNYLKVEFAADGTTQKSQILTFDVRTANASIITSNGAMSIGEWGYTGEHIVLSQASSNTNAGLGVYSMVDYAATAGKVFAGTYSRALAMTENQANQSTIVGTESQFRLRDVDIGDGVHAGLWAYAEQSGTSELSGAGTFDAISATVESASTFTVGATEQVTGITLDASIDGGASIDGSANYSAVYIKSNGLDWFYGINIEGVDDDICLQNDETITNSTDGTVAISGVLSANLRGATVIVNTDESETLTTAQSGAIVTFDGAGTATIPDPSAATIGVIYYLLQTTDANLIVTCTTADNNAFVCNGVATSDNVTISEAGHKIGSGMMIIGISATQWYVGGLNPESILTPEAAD